MSMIKFQKNGQKLLRKRNRLLAVSNVAALAKLDVGREIRKGLPEVVLAEGKEPADVGQIVNRMVARTGRALVSRASEKHLRAVRSASKSRFDVEFKPRSRMIIAKSPKYHATPSGGRVGILTAGTSDIPVAEEAEVIASEMGSKTKMYYDVGVAGLHRLFKPLTFLMRWDADVILVVAGREGALPTVVAGIVDVPVVGVPTSNSYGFGDKGVAALAAMLQSCSLGMSVVNIDGGVGAGAVAALIANRVGQFRNSKRHA